MPAAPAGVFSSLKFPVLCHRPAQLAGCPPHSLLAHLATLPQQELSKKQATELCALFRRKYEAVHGAAAAAAATASASAAFGAQAQPAAAETWPNLGAGSSSGAAGGGAPWGGRGMAGGSGNGVAAMEAEPSGPPNLGGKTFAQIQAEEEARARKAAKAAAKQRQAGSRPGSGGGSAGGAAVAAAAQRVAAVAAAQQQRQQAQQAQQQQQQQSAPAPAPSTAAAAGASGSGSRPGVDELGAELSALKATLKPLISSMMDTRVRCCVQMPGWCVQMPGCRVQLQPTQRACSMGRAPAGSRAPRPWAQRRCARPLHVRLAGAATRQSAGRRRPPPCSSPSCPPPPFLLPCSWMPSCTLRAPCRPTSPGWTMRWRACRRSGAGTQRRLRWGLVVRLHCRGGQGGKGTFGQAGRARGRPGEVPRQASRVEGAAHERGRRGRWPCVWAGQACTRPWVSWVPGSVATAQRNLLGGPV